MGTRISNIMGATTNNYIGRSQYPADPYLDGDDFRIYNRVLSMAEVQMVYNFQKPEIISLEPAVIRTIAGTSVPLLLAQIKAIYNSGLEWEVDVEWDEVDPIIYVQPGEFLVRGCVEETDLEAIVNVFVDK